MSLSIAPVEQAAPVVTLPLLARTSAASLAALGLGATWVFPAEGVFTLAVALACAVGCLVAEGCRQDPHLTSLRACRGA